MAPMPLEAPPQNGLCEHAPARQDAGPCLCPRRILMATNSKKPDTLLTHAGTNPHANFGVVNPPVYHASTILHPTVAHLEETQQRRFQKGMVSYGRHGTPTTFALEDAVAALESGERAIAY